MINTWLEWFRDWWTADSYKTTELTGIEHLRALKLLSLRQNLQQRKISSADSEKVCMYYAEILDQYENFEAVFEQPIHSVYWREHCGKRQDLRYQQWQFLVDFHGSVKLQSAKLKFKLQLHIVFPHAFKLIPPEVYINNPDYREMKLNKVFRNIYQPTLGGARIVSNDVATIWTNENYMKANNISRLIKIISQKAVKEFPFVKRVGDANKLDRDICMAEELLKILIPSKIGILEQVQDFQRGQLVLLEQTQAIDILHKSLKSELEIMKCQTSKVEMEMEQLSKRERTLKQFFPQPANKNSQEIMTLLSTSRALTDTVGIVQIAFVKREISLEEFMDKIKEMQGQKFQINYLIQNALK